MLYYFPILLSLTSFPTTTDGYLTSLKTCSYSIASDPRKYVWKSLLMKDKRNKQENGNVRKKKREDKKKARKLLLELEDSPYYGKEIMIEKNNINLEALNQYCDTGSDECSLLMGSIIDDTDSVATVSPGSNISLRSVKPSFEFDGLESMLESSRSIDNLLTIVPIISPSLAYMSYDFTASQFGALLELLSKDLNWQPVDGNLFQIQIMTPAINGIVVPSISIMFANLIGNTISTLRQRQLDIRTCLNKEANEIRSLQAMVNSYLTTSSVKEEDIKLKDEMDYQDICRGYLIRYTSRIISESQPGVIVKTLEFKGSMDSEMNGFFLTLNSLLSSESKSPDKIHPTLLSESYSAVNRLNSLRSTRISALQSTFPPLHFGILAILALSICVTFLMETNQEVLYFLNETSIKVLWTMLIGTFTSLAVVCYDLSDPFRGSYQILSSIDQLYTIREVLESEETLKKYKRFQRQLLKSKKHN